MINYFTFDLEINIFFRILPQQRCGFKKSRNREKRRSRSRKYFRCEAKNDENIKLWIAGTGFIPTGTIPTQCHCVRIKNNTVWTYFLYSDLFAVYIRLPISLYVSVIIKVYQRVLFNDYYSWLEYVYYVHPYYRVSTVILFVLRTKVVVITKSEFN